MNHNSSQSNSISFVTGGSVSITQNLVVCKYLLAPMPLGSMDVGAGEDRKLCNCVETAKFFPSPPAPTTDNRKQLPISSLIVWPMRTV